MNATLVVLLATLSIASAHIFGFGACPDVTPKRKFEMRKFMGEWFEQERYDPVFGGSSCRKFNVTRSRDGYTIGNSGLNSGEMWSSTTPALMETPGILSTGMSWWKPNEIHHVIATDYRSFAVVHSCINYFALHNENVQILSKTRRPLDAKSKKRAYKLLKASKLSTDYLTTIDHTEC